MNWRFLVCFYALVCGACGSDSKPDDASDVPSWSLQDMANPSDGNQGELADTDSDDMEAQEVSVGDVSESDLGGDSLIDDSMSDDAAVPDSWPFQLPCEDTSQSVYTAGISEVDETLPLGSVVRCATMGSIEPNKVASAAEQVGLETSSGIHMKRITYLTKRAYGEVGLATARVLLPDPLPEGPRSVLVVTHGTVGLADKCAPSLTPPPHVMGVPFAGNGTIVVLPDYAGLGNEGVQGYHDSHDTAYSVLDAVRAVHALLDPDYVSKEYAIIGHSQGGGAALYAQGLAKEYASDLELKAVVAFAPGWTSSATPDKSLYATPQFWPVTMGAGVTMAALVYAHYADAYNYVDKSGPGVYFSEAWRETLVDWIETECVSSLAEKFMGLEPGLTALELFEPAFLMVSLSCLQGDPACSQPIQGYVERRQENYVPMDVSGAPVLLVQGMADAQVKPMKAACNVKAMKESGFVPFVSVDPQATHFDVVKRNLSLAYEWIQAKMIESEPPTWSFDATTLPTCD